jgi:hypothetical protein
VLRTESFATLYLPRRAPAMPVAACGQWQSVHLDTILPHLTQSVSVALAGVN